MTAALVEAYRDLIRTFPEPCLLVTHRGEILAANSAGTSLLATPESELRGRELSAIVCEQAEALRAYLGVCSRSRSMVFGALTVRAPNGGAAAYRAEGAVVRAAGGGADAIIFLKLRPRRTASPQFLLLNRKIEALTREVRRRQLVETELTRANADLAMRTEEAESARAAAMDASEIKSRFLATMSHEIRTPMNAIIGYVQLLQLGLTGPLTTQQRQSLDRIAVSTRHLLALVDEVLDIARIDSGQLKVRRVIRPIGDAVEAALAIIAPQADAMGLALEDRCAEGARQRYVGDEDRVRQILVNLLSNAVKFTDRGGRIIIECGTTNEPDREAILQCGMPWSFVRVADTGIGIESEHLGRIFDDFVQLESGLTRTRGGAGLGLTISRRLARLMGGDLSVRSVPGKGSVFTLWLSAPEGDDGATATEASALAGSEVDRRNAHSRVDR